MAKLFDFKGRAIQKRETAELAAREAEADRLLHEEHRHLPVYYVIERYKAGLPLSKELKKYAVGYIAEDEDRADFNQNAPESVKAEGYPGNPWREELPRKRLREYEREQAWRRYYAGQKIQLFFWVLALVVGVGAAIFFGYGKYVFIGMACVVVINWIEGLCRAKR